MNTKRSNCRTARREPLTEALAAAAAAQDDAALASMKAALANLRSAQRLEALLAAQLSTRIRRIVT
jgi:hypothetical protein